jgi:xyloglucan fucosyltransferase
MALEGVVGIGIAKRPSLQCLDAVENAARRAEPDERTVEQSTTPWMIARKKVTALAVCLVALPVLMTTVSRRDSPWTPASFWPLATFARQGNNVVIHTLFIYHIL